MNERAVTTSSPARLRCLIAAVTAIGGVVVVGAGLAVVLDAPTLSAGLAILLFGALTLIADLKPVPLDEHGDRSVSLAFVFILATEILFGWPYAVLAALCAITVSQLFERKPAQRVLFNASVYALSAFALGLTTFGLPRPVGTLPITLHALLGGAVYVGCNVALVCAAIAVSRGLPLRQTLRDNLHHAGSAFVIMALLGALVARLWTIEPGGIVLIAGPLFTLALYQRSALASRVAMQSALTDSLTALGNRRSFEIAVTGSLADLAEAREGVSLCVVDIDDFKDINDIHGHPVGDGVLVQLSEILRSEPLVSPYRLGGDEFALVVRGGPAVAHECARRLHERIAVTPFVHGQPVTVSIGIGSFPEHASGVEDLERVADGALYWAKRHGKNRVSVYSPSSISVYPPEGLARNAEQRARIRAAENLIRVVDAKDSYTGAHSEAVARLVERIGTVMGHDDETVHRLRLAGLLHDLGKIALPDGILKKPGRLTESERRLIRTHPGLGASLLDGLDLDLIDLWVRHHHEHWDGSGYPDGLAGEEIPLGSRIILVADAFEAMTTDRSYRLAASAESALGELRRMAGVQFDSAIVDALQVALDRPALPDTALAVPIAA